MLHPPAVIPVLVTGTHRAALPDGAVRTMGPGNKCRDDTEFGWCPHYHPPAVIPVLVTGTHCAELPAGAVRTMGPGNTCRDDSENGVVETPGTYKVPKLNPRR
jgi:hypothetical protein